MCLELPAGLIDEGEGAGEAALRELKEETGYHGRLLSLTPVCASDPGMSAANMVVALVEVASDAPENADVEQNLHDGEFISVEMAPWDDLMSWLLEKKHREGCQVDARLLAFAMGLHEGKIMEHADHAKEETDNEPTGVALPVVDSPETLPAHGCGKATSTEGNGAHEGEGAAAEGSAVQGLIDVVRSTSFVAGAVSGAVLASILLCALRR